MQNTSQTKRKIIAEQDIAKLYKHLRGEYNIRLRSTTPMRTLAICMLMEQTGMRIGEVCALKPSDIVAIDAYRMNIHVPYMPKYTKAGARTVPLIAYTLEHKATPAWEAIQRWQRLKEKKQITSEWLFCTTTGAQIRPDTVGSYITEEAQEAGIPYHVTAHMFRHTAATRYARKYNNPQLVQKLLGHSNISTTQIYFHLNEDDVAAMLSDSENSNGFTAEELALMSKDLQ